MYEEAETQGGRGAHGPTVYEEQSQVLAVSRARVFPGHRALSPSTVKEAEATGSGFPPSHTARSRQEGQGQAPKVLSPKGPFAPV